MIKALEKEELIKGYKILIKITDGYSIVEVIEIDGEDVIVTGGFDIYPNEDGHYFVTNYYEL